MSQTADGELLLGLLALQNAFITRDQLVAAFGSWTADKSRPLQEILVAQGAIDLRRRDLLLALADQHAEMNGGSPAQSLVALSSVVSARAALEGLKDPALSQSLKIQHPTSADPWATRAAAAPVVGRRFEVLRPHAAGGLGIVSVARDREVPRDVALKEIRPEAADNVEARMRFLREAEITGSLEHPGIVPIYGLGAYDDDRPYYAMKFIRGDSLRAALEKFHKRRAQGEIGFESVDFRQLLQCFIDVCQAVQFAHDRGVLHRDLKPANIMLGEYGETLVVDWGLAKLMTERASALAHRPSQSTVAFAQSQSGSSGSETLPGSVVGTPQYMSPEQAAGAAEHVGPATDVYALGATLYHVLAGQPSVGGGDLAEALERVRQGEILPPRAVVSTIPLPLQQICQRAMALRPDQRYSAARGLAEDLEHYLADEPIDAAPDTAMQSAARFARRHRGLVGTSMAALLCIAVGASAAGLVINHQRGIALRLADEKSHLAQLEQAERTRAESALKTLDAALMRMARGDEGAVQLDAELQRLRDDPAFADVRLLLSKRMLLDLEFVTQNSAAGSTPQLAATQGFLQLQLAQLTTDRQQKAAWVDQAVAKLTAAVEGQSQDRQLTLRLSDALNLRGQSLTGQAQREAFENCLQLRTALLQKVGEADDAEAVEIHRKTLSIRHNLALVSTASFPKPDVAALQQVALERSALFERHPENSLLANDVADSELALASCVTGDAAALRRHYQRAIAYYQHSDVSNSSTVTRSRWFEALRGKLETELASGDLSAARESADELFLLTTRALRNSTLRDLVARGFYSSGSVALESWVANPSRAEHGELADEHLRLAVALYTVLTESPDAEPRLWHDLAAAAALRGKLLERLPMKANAATRMFEIARRALESLQTADPALFEAPATQELYRETLQRIAPPSVNRST